jgi:DNA-binding winged helix-turn-helix (wHTH) protein
MEENELQPQVCFGPFEVDLRTQEIRKHGMVIRLSGQPFQILAMLLSRPGELIARDEFESRLWPSVSVVDCTHGLNAAINKLREALSDSAVSPQYVETLPRRGYRFIGTIRKTASDFPSPVEAAPPALTPDPVSSLIQQPIPAPRHLMSRRWSIAMMTFVALVIGAVLGFALNSEFGTRVVQAPQPTPLSPPEAPEKRAKEQSEFHGPNPEPLHQHSVRISGAIARPAILREPARTPQHDPTLRTVVSGSGSAAPQFSPDGKHIAFMSDRSGTWQIWVSSVDGSHAVQISTTDSAGTPRWSPDGKRIVFDAPCDGGTCIFIAPINRSEPSRQLEEGKVPSFSRSGKWVFFASERGDRWQVWKVPASGGRATQVTRQGGFAALQSSDGYLYYAKSGFGSPEIWRIPMAGGKETEVSDRVRPRTWASWTVTQKGILFVSDHPDQGPQLSLYETATQQVHQLLSLPSAPFWMGATSDGRRVAVNDARERQITLVENLR